MVRRLKSDLRRLGEAFPERIIEPIRIDGLPEDAPELELARRLAAYGELRMKRIASLPSRRRRWRNSPLSDCSNGCSRPIAAFARTLKVHRATLQRMLDGEEAAGRGRGAGRSWKDPRRKIAPSSAWKTTSAEQAIDADDDATAEAASALGAAGAAQGDLRSRTGRGRRDAGFAERHASRPDARVHWLVDWIKANLLAGTDWNRRRLIIFTEYEDTRRWLERRLREALADTDRADDRIGVFTGATDRIDARRSSGPSTPTRTRSRCAS